MYGVCHFSLMRASARVCVYGYMKEGERKEEKKGPDLWYITYQ